MLLVQYESLEEYDFKNMNARASKFRSATGNNSSIHKFSELPSVELVHLYHS